MASPSQWTWVWVDSRSGDGQGSLACCGSWGFKESDTTERLNWKSSRRALSALYWTGKISSFLLQDSSCKISFPSSWTRPRTGPLKWCCLNWVQVCLSEKTNWILSLEASSLKPEPRKEQGISGRKKNLEWGAVSHSPKSISSSGFRKESSLHWSVTVTQGGSP